MLRNVTQLDPDRNSLPLPLPPIPDERSSPSPARTGHRRRPAAANPTTSGAIQFSLKFNPISRDVREGDAPSRTGRFADRSGLGILNAPGSNKLALKSKVISRVHAEIWLYPAVNSSFETSSHPQALNNKLSSLPT